MESSLDKQLLEVGLRQSLPEGNWTTSWQKFSPDSLHSQVLKKQHAPQDMLLGFNDAEPET